MWMLTEKKQYPWMVVGMLWVVALLNYLDRQMLSTMRPFMMEDISELVSVTNFGRLMAIFLWVYAFMSPFSGMIADWLNRKWMIVISLLVWSSVTLMMGYAQNLEQLYVLRAIMGISEAFYVPASLSLIVDYHQGKSRSLAIGFHTTGIYLGQALGGFGATIATYTSWQFTFHSFGMIGIIYSVILIAFLREKKTYVIEKSQRSSLKDFAFAFKGFSILLGNISFWTLIFYFSAPSLPGWATKNWLPTLFCDTLHLDMAHSGPLATIVISFSSLIGVLIGGYISDKWVQKHLKGRIYTGVIGVCLTIPALFLLGYGQGLTAILSGAFCFGLGFGVFDVNNMPIICQFVSSRYRSTAYGILNLVGISAGAIVTNELGKAIESGYMDIVFLVMIATLCVAITLQLIVLHPKTIDMKNDL